MLTTGSLLCIFQVATGGDQHWQLPMLIIIPAFHVTPGVGPAMLGFGDILLPGLLGVYTRSFDLYNKLSARQSYFWPCAAGYAVGLLLTYVALYYSIGGDQGQPALLYLVPCTLGLVLLLASMRKHLNIMWLSESPTNESGSTGHDAESNQVRDEETPLL